MFKILLGSQLFINLPNVYSKRGKKGGVSDKYVSQTTSTK